MDAFYKWAAGQVADFKARMPAARDAQAAQAAQAAGPAGAAAPAAPAEPSSASIMQAALADWEAARAASWRAKRLPAGEATRAYAEKRKHILAAADRLHGSGKPKLQRAIYVDSIDPQGNVGLTAELGAGRFQLHLPPDQYGRHIAQDRPDIHKHLMATADAATAKTLGEMFPLQFGPESAAPKP